MVSSNNIGDKLRDCLIQGHGVSTENDNETREFLSACAKVDISWASNLPADRHWPDELEHAHIFFILLDGRYLRYGEVIGLHAGRYKIAPWHTIKQEIYFVSSFIY